MSFMWPDRPVDPPWLWPTAIILAMAMHGGGWWWLRTQPIGDPTQTDPTVIEVIPLAAQPSPQGAAPVASAAAEPSAPSPPPEAAPSPSAATPEPPAVSTSPRQPLASPASPPPLPSPSASPSPSPVPQVSTAPPPASPDPMPSAPPTTDSAPSPSAPSAAPGLLTWWTLRPIPEGRDVPDERPTIPADWQARTLTPEDSPCLSTELSALSASTTVALRPTIEGDGRVSQATVWRSSGNAVYDAAMVCLLESQVVPFEPARAGGEPIPTDMFLVEVTGQGQP